MDEIVLDFFPVKITSMKSVVQRSPVNDGIVSY